MGKETNQVIELLNELQTRTGCLYLSDLHTPEYRASVFASLKAMSFPDYPLEALNQVLQYITSSDIFFTDLQSALEYIQNQANL